MATTEATKRAPTNGNRAVMIWIALSIVAAALIWLLRGQAGLEQGVDSYAEQMLELLPRMLCGLLMGGFAQVLVPRSLVIEWLGDGAGFKGLVIATVVGGIAPGGPMVAFPLVVVLRNAGASPACLVAFMTAWATIAFHRIIIWEVSMLGPEIALVRYLSSMGLGIVAGLLAAPIARAVRYTTKAAP